MLKSRRCVSTLCHCQMERRQCRRGNKTICSAHLVLFLANLSLILRYNICQANKQNGRWYVVMHFYALLLTAGMARFSHQVFIDVYLIDKKMARDFGNWFYFPTTGPERGIPRIRRCKSMTRLALASRFGKSSDSHILHWCIHHSPLAPLFLTRQHVYRQNKQLHQ